MELTLSTETVKYYRTVLKKSVSHEETMEMNVPDAQPDISRVVMTDGVVMLRGKEAVSGNVSVSGLVNGAVLYMSEDSEAVQKLDYSLSFVMSAENPEVTSDTEILVKLLLTGIEAKTVNSRKVIIRANTEACLECMNKTELILSSGIKNADGSSIETMCQNERAVPASFVTEKRFVVTDEYKMPTTKPALDEILTGSVNIVCDDVKTVGNKLIVKGTAFVTMLYTGKDGTGIASAEFQSVFSQILELDVKCDDSMFTVDIAITGVYLNADDYNASGEQCIMVEVHAVAQCKAYVPMDLDLMTDLYSTKYALDIARDEFEIKSLEGRDTISEVFRDTIAITEPVKAFLNSTVRLGCMDVVETDSGKKIVGVSFITVRYISETDTLVAVSK